jgi:hypothetical protein
VLTSKGILSGFQKSFLQFFGSLPDQERFYLTGGTALVEYYLGHRLSFDLDLFTSETDLIVPFSYRLEQAARSAGMEVAVVRRFASFVEFQVNQGDSRLKIDLGLDTPFRFTPAELSDSSVRVNDFQDIQTDKTLALFGRAEPRDAIDLYFLLQRKSFVELANLARQKGTGFDLYWFAVALNRTGTFPDEIERWPVRLLLVCDPVALKRSFHSLAMQIMAEQTGKQG